MLSTSTTETGLPYFVLHIRNDKLCFPHAKSGPFPLVSFVEEACCIRKESLDGQDSLCRILTIPEN